MKAELLKFISKFPSLDEEEVKQIVDTINAIECPKGTILLKEGQINNLCYFVIKGCVRQHFMVDGEEKTTAFYTEEQAAFSMTNYVAQAPSDHYLSCVEDSILIAGDPTQEKEMQLKFPKLANITRMMVEQDYGKSQAKLTSFIISSPEERYLNLLKDRPDLFQRVPQHQIASYLGMKPESLSRIRKRVIQKK